MTTGRRDRGAVLALMRAMAAGPEGLTNAALAQRLDIAQTNIPGRISQAQRNGHLFRAARKGYPLHWFDTAERAAAWAAMPALHKPALQSLPTDPARTILAKKQGPAALTKYAAHPTKPGVPAPVHIPDAPQVSGEVTVPATVVVSRGLSAGYDPRRQCAPGEQPYGAGFAAVGIGRSVTTGQGWGASA
jgi:hypothetical protein